MGCLPDIPASTNVCVLTQKAFGSDARIGRVFLYPAYRHVADGTIRHDFSNRERPPLGVTATVRQINTGVRAFGSAGHNVILVHGNKYFIILRRLQ
jgi:hypothetical protein